MDLAEGHMAALKWLFEKSEFIGVEVFNLGTGDATSVLEIVYAFEQVTKNAVPYEISPRREGDLPEFWADATKAEKELGWRTKHSLEEMMQDTWRWQSNNPDGYP